MKQNCINHSYSDAHWYCKKCDKPYCFSCIEKKSFEFSKDEAYVHICPECKRIAEWIGIDIVTDSFFIGFVKSFLYPFSLNSLIVLCLLMAVSLFLTENIVINEILFGIIWVCLISYSQTIVESTLKGQQKPPKFTDVPIPKLINHIFMIFKQSLVYLIVCTIFVLSTAYLDKPAIPGTILTISSLIMPFVLMKNLTAGSLKNFLDPGPFFRIIKKAGINYLVLSILFVPIVSLFHLMLTYNPKFVIPLICYLVVVIYRIIGQMILKCNKELGYSIDYENFKDMISLESKHGFKA